MSVELFEKFLADDNAYEFFITGPAGRGKTTSLAKYAEYLHNNNVPFVVCAYTHKACGVLRSKLPSYATVMTLHKFLRKRPTINTDAKLVQHVELSAVFDTVEKKAIVLIDEFSQVGEQDLMDLRAAQDPDYDGDVAMKIVWIGDPYQLPPVKDAEAVIPHEPYWVKLTKNYRQGKNPLGETVDLLLEMIDGTREPASLPRHDHFRYAEDVLGAYQSSSNTNKLFLAYTNKRVQDVNFALAGRERPEPGDKLFCPTVNRFFHFIRQVPKGEVYVVDRFWDDPLMFNSKYKTLEFLLEMDVCDFFEVEDEDGEQYTYATVFGTYNSKVLKEQYAKIATEANLAIEREHKTPAKVWATAHPMHPMARKRALAWRKYLTLKDMSCMDFSYAMTVHKSQGSTVDEVYLDAQDLYLCATRNFNLYLRLYYVAISRASNFAVTN